MYEVGFIGAGRMARAMVEGIIRRQTYSPGEIACLGGQGESAKILATDTGIQQLDDLHELAEKCSILVLAFKPHHMETLEPSIHQSAAGKCVVSILAGVPLHQLMHYFPSASNIIRAMPNLPASIGCGVTGYALWKELVGRDRRAISHLLEAVGLALEVEEQQIDAVTGISGSGVAFVFEFIKALSEAGNFQGLPEQQAQQFVVETVLGAAHLVKQSGQSPARLQESVMTKGGTTEAGMRILRESGFDRLLQEAAAAAAQRSREIAETSAKIP